MKKIHVILGFSTLFGLLLAGCGSTDVHVTATPLVCIDKGTSLVNLNRIASTSVYTGTAIDPLARCAEKPAKVVRVNNNSGFDFVLSHDTAASVPITITTGTGTAMFNGSAITSTWKAQLLGSSSAFPPVIAIELGWTKPISGTSATPSAVLITPPPTPATSLVSLQSINVNASYIAHGDFLGVLTTALDAEVKSNATFRMVPGLADTSGISFESINFPGHYLRHQDLRIKLHIATDEPLFRADATYFKVPGLADSTGVSFRSLNFPDRFLRHRGSELWIDEETTGTGAGTFEQDATFRIVSPLTTDIGPIAYPDGDLLTAPDSKIYVLHQGHLWLVPNAAALTAYGFTASDAKPISTQVVEQIPMGGELPAITKNIVRAADGDGGVYVLDRGLRRHVPNPEALAAYVIGADAIEQLPTEVVEQIPMGEALPAITKNIVRAADGGVYVLDMGHRRHVSDPVVADAYGITSADWEQLPTEVVEQIPRGANLPHVTKQVIRGPDGAAYLLEKGRRRYVPNMEIFNKHGLGSRDVEQVSTEFISQIPVGPDLQ